MRVRFTHVTDTHITHLAATYTPHTRTIDAAEEAGTAAEFAHIVSQLKTDHGDTRFGDAA